MLSFHSQGRVIALEVYLGGHREECALYMVASWLPAAVQGSRRWVRVGVTPAEILEDIEGVRVGTIQYV